MRGRVQTHIYRNVFGITVVKYEGKKDKGKGQAKRGQHGHSDFLRSSCIVLVWFVYEVGVGGQYMVCVYAL